MFMIAPPCSTRLILVPETTDSPPADLPDYQELVQAFTEERILERKEYLYIFASDLIRRHKLDQDHFFVSPTLIDEVVVNYFADFKRLKDFHKLERGNRIKIASYMAYWIARERPIQLIAEHYESRQAVKINQLLALGIIIDVMFTQRDVFTPELDKMNNFVDLLLYTLRYRVFTAQSIELALQALIIEKLPYV